MKRWFAVIALLLCFPLAQRVAAQELTSANPTVMFEGHTIEIEPEKGPVQVCVVKTITTETLDQTTVEAEGIIIAHNTDQWIITGVYTDDVTPGGQGSHIGDCGRIAWD